jgi:hypothetical protein
MIDYSTMPPRTQAPLRTSPFHQYIFDDGTVWTEFHRRDEGYLLRFPELADFEVSADGTEVVVYPTMDAEETTVEHLYINQMVPLALSRQGRPAFHASVVTVPGGAVAFLGKSGMGKSTLAASFALNDAAFLTDDALLIEETPGGLLATPSHASVRLWKDSVDALIDQDNPRAGPISYSDKARLLAGDALAYDDQPQPLLAAFVLDNQAVSAIAIAALDGAARQMAWVGNSFLLDIEDKALLAKHFEWTHRMSSSVPTFSLDYPREFCMLAEVRHAVRQHVAELDG